MAKNVLPKHWNGSEFEELHIVTKASNVFTNDNKSVQQKIDNFTSHLAEYVNVDEYGAVGDGVTDDTAAIKNAVAAAHYKKLQFNSNKTYVIKQFNQIVLSGDIKIDGQGATIIVPADTVLVDTDGYDNVYNNAVFKAAIGTQSNIEICNLNFVFQKEKTSAILLGNVNTPIGDGLRRNIHIHDCTLNGNNNIGTFLVIAYGSQLIVENNYVHHAFGLVYGSENSGWIKNNTCEYIGVNDELTTWNNTTAIRFTGGRDLEIDSNVIRYTGGTALSVSAPVSVTSNVTISNNKIYAAGLCGIGAGNKPGGGGLRNVNIIGNMIIGYCCAPNGDLHPAIEIGSSDPEGASEDFMVLNNIIDFLAPYESFDTINFDCLNSKNSKKSATVLGNGMVAISCQHAASNNSKRFTIKGNHIKYNKEVSIRVGYVSDVSIVDNQFYQCGWERDAVTKMPLFVYGNNAIRVAYSCNVTVKGNIINELCNGLNTTSQGTIVIRLEKCTNFIVSENSYFTLTSGHNKAFCTINAGSSAEEYFTLFGHTNSLFKGAIVNNYLFNDDIAIFDAVANGNYNHKIFLMSADRISDTILRPERGFDGTLHVRSNDIVSIEATTDAGKLPIWVDGTKRYIQVYSS